MTILVIVLGLAFVATFILLCVVTGRCWEWKVKASQYEGDYEHLSDKNNELQNEIEEFRDRVRNLRVGNLKRGNLMDRVIKDRDDAYHLLEMVLTQDMSGTGHFEDVSVEVNRSGVQYVFKHEPPQFINQVQVTGKGSA